MPRLKKEDADVLPLADYVKAMEAAALPLTVCEIVHPEAVNGSVHQGVYSGIRLTKGDAASAKLSDGSVL